MFVTFDMLIIEILKPVILLQFMNISFIVVTFEVLNEPTLIELKLEQFLNIQSRLVAFLVERLCSNEVNFLQPLNIYANDVALEESKFRMSRLANEEQHSNMQRISLTLEVLK